jgi:hypothetical protein
MGRRGTRIGYWRESQEKRQIGRPRRRWVESIKMDLGEIGWGGVDWMVWLRIETSGELL